MTLLMRDQENIEKGIQQGIQQGIRLMIESGKELGIDRNSIFAKVKEKYQLSEEQTCICMDQYWK